MVAQAHDGGGGGEGMFCQLVDAHIYHEIRMRQNAFGDFSFCIGERLGAFPKSQQCVAHGFTSAFLLFTEHFNGFRR